MQVQALFSDAPDLLEEFKDFSPKALSLTSQQNGPWNPLFDTQQAEKPAKSVSQMKKRVADEEISQKTAPSRVRCAPHRYLGLFS